VVPPKPERDGGLDPAWRYNTERETNDAVLPVYGIHFEGSSDFRQTVLTGGKT
jgi:hypothetical protein